MERFSSSERWWGLSQSEKRRVVAFCAEAVELIVRSRRVVALATRAAMRDRKIKEV